MTTTRRVEERERERGPLDATRFPLEGKSAPHKLFVRFFFFVNLFRRVFYFIQEKAFIKRFFDDTVVFFPFIAFPSVLPPSKEEERKRERDDQKRKKNEKP